MIMHTYLHIIESIFTPREVAYISVYPLKTFKCQFMCWKKYGRTLF